MVSLYRDPRYVELARVAAAALGAPNTPTVAAILAQWGCEQPSPAPWPVIHHNPGNLTRYVRPLDGEPSTVATTAPGAGLLLVYASDAAGARAYANYLLHSSRYRAAITAARASLGPAFLTDVCQAGYGTQLRCALSLYPGALASLVPTVQPSWRCDALSVNVRAGAGTTFAIVGHVNRGQVVTGLAMQGGVYTTAGGRHSTWLHIGAGRYVAAAYFTRL